MLRESRGARGHAGAAGAAQLLPLPDPLLQQLHNEPWQDPQPVSAELRAPTKTSPQNNVGLF